MVRVWRLALQLSEGASEGARRTVAITLSLWSKMGMNLGQDTLRVVNTTPGGQAEDKGVRPGWVCKRVGDTAVGTLTEFMAAVNGTREQGIAEVAVLFELDPAASAKAKAEAASGTPKAAGAAPRKGLFGFSSKGGTPKAGDSDRPGGQADAEAGPGAQQGGGQGGAAASGASASASASLPISFLVAAFSQTLGPARQLKPLEERAWFDAHDGNKDGLLSLAEFTGAINAAKEMSKAAALAESPGSKPGTPKAGGSKPGKAVT
jgi:hypothetical protein